jgi:guanine deaminase
MDKMAGEKKNTVYHGTFIHSKALDELEYLHNTAVFVDKEGRIVAIERECDLTTAALSTTVSKLGWTPDVSIEALTDGQFFFPGFIGEFAALT